MIYAILAQIIGKGNIRFLLCPLRVALPYLYTLKKPTTPACAGAGCANKDSAFKLEVKSYSKPSDKIKCRNPAKVGNKQRHDNSGIKPLIVIHFLFQNGDSRGTGYKEHHHH